MDTRIYQGFLEYFMRERILVFGRSECGKTSLIQSLMQFQFLAQTCSRTQENHRIRRTYESSGRLRQNNITKPQVSDQYFFMSQYGDANVVMRIWDLSMEHLFIFLDPSYQRSQLLLAVYDSSDIDELYQIRAPLELYIKTITEEQRARLTIFVVANKIDIEPVHPLPYDMDVWFQANQIRYFYVSVSLNKGIDMLRACMLQSIYQKQQRNNLWIHRDSMAERFMAKFNCSPWSIHNHQRTEQTTYSYEEGDYGLIRYYRRIPFHQHTDSLILTNMRIAFQNICQCLDHLTMATETTESKSDKKLPKICDY